MVEFFVDYKVVFGVIFYVENDVVLYIDIV